MSTYVAACECLRDESDMERLVLEVAEDAKASGVLWVELALSMCLYHERFGGMKPTLLLLIQCAEAAERHTGVGISYIVSAERMTNLFPMQMGAELATTVAEMVVAGEVSIDHTSIHGYLRCSRLFS